MELLLGVYYDPKNLAGKPQEFDPFVAVWTTDSEQTQTVVPGKAVDVVDLDAHGYSKRSVCFRSKDTDFPIRDPMADICVSLYTRSESDGSNPKAGKNRPYTVDIGQINIPWHVVLRFMISSGAAFIAKMDKAETDAANRSRVFPSVKIKQEVKSLVTYEGVEYEIQAQMANDQNLAMELKRAGPDALSRRGELVIIASLVATTKETQALTLKERIDRIEYFYLKQCPIYKEKKVTLGESEPMRIVKASQYYDERTSEEDRLYNTAMDRYRGVYDALWTAVGKRQLVIKSHDGSKETTFEPDVPSMSRFHLPTWNLCNDRIPYAEWILQTVPENASHLAKPTLGTEFFLSTLANMSFKRVNISREEFLETANGFTLNAASMDVREFSLMLKTGHPKRTLVIKTVEIVFYTIMMVAHATRYEGDGRLIRLFKRMVRVDVEAPQHDMVSGTSDGGDCEDEETPEIIILSLLQLGRVGGDLASGGRGWSDPTLAAMRRVIQLYVDYTIFGSVSGRQISDKQRKEGIEDEEGLIETVDDKTEPIGGHTYLVGQSLAESASRYEEHHKLVDVIVGYSVSQRIREHLLGVIRGWTGKADSELERLLLKLYKSLPSPIFEGTGRQEPLQLPLEAYFGISEEFLQRLAARASEIDLLERWPKAVQENETKKKKKSRHHEDSSNESDASESTDSESEREDLGRVAVPSMGDATPYMYQKRLTMLSMTKKTPQGTLLQRHLSSFYRRPCHTVSCKLHQIMPNEFVHCIFINPERRTYGPPLRYLIEADGPALAIPLSRELHRTYLSPVEQTKVGTIHYSDLLARRIRRIIPYDLSFQHLKMEQQETQLVVSNNSIQQGIKSCSDFFCRSDFEHSGNGVSKSSFSSNKTSLVVAVNPDSPIAVAITQLAPKGSKSYSVPNVFSRMITRPVDGKITEDSIKLLSQHVLSGSGVGKLTIYSERVLPWLSENLTACFQRTVTFEIRDLPPKSQLPLLHSNNLAIRSTNRLDLLMQSSQWSIDALMMKLGVNPAVIRPERIRAGILVELEHGTKLVYKQTNVTNDNLLKTTQIVLAHLVENPGLWDESTNMYIIPDYYHRLAEMEKASDAEWKNYVKPAVFLPKQARRIQAVTLTMSDLQY